MKRRDALARVALLMGGTLSAPTMIVLLDGCKTADETSKAAKFALSTDQQTLVSEVAEIIIPKTDTPGAKEAKVGEFIEKMLTDCYYTKDQKSFKDGLSALDDKKFMKATPEEQTKILSDLEKASKDELAKIGEDRKKAQEAGQTFEEPGVPFFRLMKELTLLGYFTSEVGATQALEYVPVPTRYDGCIDLKPGQKAWAM
ncbi:gluconate 2-dehydrogenase subunit 3 family protein [Rhabdobacter roseus]|uniref:Gluconate 2-dehydrogenase subunit 3 family protein n=1 Tax=Rhabdobacter roseus TaxID=1655419 RepID=A0A840TX29_9BACT|nr:gluconate 2-dehydrogenase subunit 3 family protein [Rhabdobacter roseus]MBB5284199.1 hypothetical protein [Rhabdobacter roseus]